MMAKSRFILYPVVFLVSLSILAAQVLLARESRVAFGFGLEFIIFSVAIAGLGFGGLAAFFLSQDKNWEIVVRWLGLALPTLPISIALPALVLHYVNAFTSPTVSLVSDMTFFGASFLPYLTAGFIISLIFKYHHRNISQLYFIDLVGAGAGAALSIWLMDGLGTPLSTAVVILIATAPALLFSFSQESSRKIALLVAPLVLALSLGGSTSFQVTCKPNESPLLVASNSFSQVNIQTAPSSPNKITEEELGMSDPQDFKGIKLLNLVRDCRESTAYFIQFNKLSDVEKLKSSIYNLPYLLRSYQRVVELGSGPGNAMLVGELNNVPDIEAVEINPLVISSISRFIDYDIYRQPNVHLHVAEGRNFIASSTQDFDLIFIFTREFGGIGTAAYAFSQNYLFTTEAYSAYLNRLSSRGVVAIAGSNPFIRTILPTIAQSLRGQDMDPTEHLLQTNGQAYSILMFSKTAFTKTEVERFSSAALALGYKVAPPTADTLSSQLKDKILVTDDKPSFWDITGLKQLFGVSQPEILDARTSLSSVAVFNSFLVLLGLTTLLFLTLLVVPFKFGRIKNTPNLKYLLTFFAFISVGFIAFELTLMQKLALFLEAPQFSVAIALSAILVFGGLGSQLTRNIRTDQLHRKLKVILLAFIILSSIYLLQFGSFYDRWSGLSQPARVILSVAILAPPSLLIGMIFPIGLKLTSLVSEELIPWMYSLDGVGSVLGGVLAEAIFLTFGFQAEFMIVITTYILALLTILKMEAADHG